MATNDSTGARKTRWPGWLVATIAILFLGLMGFVLCEVYSNFGVQSLSTEPKLLSTHATLLITKLGGAPLFMDQETVGHQTDSHDFGCAIHVEGEVEGLDQPNSSVICFVLWLPSGMPYVLEGYANPDPAGHWSINLAVDGLALPRSVDLSNAACRLQAVLRSEPLEAGPISWKDWQSSQVKCSQAVSFIISSNDIQLATNSDNDDQSSQESDGKFKIQWDGEQAPSDFLANYQADLHGTVSGINPSSDLETDNVPYVWLAWSAQGQDLWTFMRVQPDSDGNWAVSPGTLPLTDGKYLVAAFVSGKSSISPCSQTIWRAHAIDSTAVGSLWIVSNSLLSSDALCMLGDDPSRYLISYWAILGAILALILLFDVVIPAIHKAGGLAAEQGHDPTMNTSGKKIIAFILICVNLYAVAHYFPFYVRILFCGWNHIPLTVTESQSTAQGWLMFFSSLQAGLLLALAGAEGNKGKGRFNPVIFAVSSAVILLAILQGFCYAGMTQNSAVLFCLGLFIAVIEILVIHISVTTLLEKPNSYAVSNPAEPIETKEAQ
jgi:hypothetical protein